jgi:hypothetical protein
MLQTGIMPQIAVRRAGAAGSVAWLTVLREENRRAVERRAAGQPAPLREIELPDAG